MIGTGLTPEGIEQNDVIFEVMNEMGWRTNEINATDWVKKFANRRYGNINAYIIGKNI